MGLLVFLWCSIPARSGRSAAHHHYARTTPQRNAHVLACVRMRVLMCVHSCVPRARRRLCRVRNAVIFHQAKNMIFYLVAAVERPSDVVVSSSSSREGRGCVDAACTCPKPSYYTHISMIARGQGDDVYTHEVSSP